MYKDYYLVLGKIDTNDNWQLIKKDTKANCMAFVFENYHDLCSQYLNIIIPSEFEFDGLLDEKRTIH